MSKNRKYTKTYFGTLTEAKDGKSMAVFPSFHTTFTAETVDEVLNISQEKLSKIAEVLRKERKPLPRPVSFDEIKEANPHTTIVQVVIDV